MPLYNARHPKRLGFPVRMTNARLGFTLAEISAIVVIVGVLAAVGIPNFLGMYQRFQANSAFDKVRAAVQEAQLQAIRKNRGNENFPSPSCTLVIDETAKTITVEDATLDRGCLLENVKLPDSAGIRTNNGTIRFNYKGEPLGSLQTIVVFDNSQNYKKCLVISNLIGMMRSGFYNGSLNTAIVGTSCDTE